MIKTGSDGSLSLFFNNQLIASFPLSKKKTYIRYKFQGDLLILETMRKKHMNIKAQKFIYNQYCINILRNKNKGNSIRKRDAELFLGCIFALIKLKFLDEDDAIFIQPNRKTNRKSM